MFNVLVSFSRGKGTLYDSYQNRNSGNLYRNKQYAKSQNINYLISWLKKKIMYLY